MERLFGFRELRPFQESAIRAALEGRDLLLVLPTGGGKSLCYQAPALVRDGFTAVVSPLISLMKDQVDGLLEYGAPAAMLSSAQDAGERHQVLEDLDRGLVKLLFVSPERLVMDGFLERLVDCGLSAVAVDEAHCISHWGHDFRPEYRRLGELRRELPDVPIQAFTATATAAVREDVARELGLRDPAVLVAPCDRPNLVYRMRPRAQLTRQVLGVIEAHPGGAGIVYCLSRRDTEELSAELAGRGIRCAPYHAGLEAGLRRRTQERFQSEEVDVVVATVAFGMGIDRPDVRFVVHASLPKGIEQYSQETGRAGRDGLPAECVMFYSASDFYGWRGLLERGFQEAREGGTEVSEEVVDGSFERLGKMLRFATGGVCRHRVLVEYFGQSWERPGEEEGCGACDVCLGELTKVDDSLVLAQKILSCVVHCEQRYGASHVADVLRGAATAGIRRAGHDRATTYGLLSAHGSREIRGWIEQLVGLDHLRVAGSKYPTLYLSQSGVEVMRGEHGVRLFVQPQARKSAGRSSVASLAAESDGPPVDPSLFEELRLFRRELARERGVPPYVIFGDRTLAQMAATKPRTAEAFRELKGVGDVKATSLGPLFLAAIERYEQRSGEGSSPAPRDSDGG